MQPGKNVHSRLDPLRVRFNSSIYMCRKSILHLTSSFFYIYAFVIVTHSWCMEICMDEPCNLTGQVQKQFESGKHSREYGIYTHCTTITLTSRLSLFCVNFLPQQPHTQGSPEMPCISLVCKMLTGTCPHMQYWQSSYMYIPCAHELHYCLKQMYVIYILSPYGKVIGVLPVTY